jgi:hypothetical protein
MRAVHKVLVAVWFLVGLLALSACDFIPGQGGPDILSDNGYVDRDSTGAYRVLVGEVQNTGSTNLRYVKIEARFYTQDGSLHSSADAYTHLKMLLPGEKSSFRIIEATVPEVDRYRLEVVEFKETDVQPYRDLEVVSQTADTDSLGYYHVAGDVKNAGVERAEYATAFATCYDGRGQVVGVGEGPVGTEPWQLGPGETASFDLQVLPADSAADIVHCTVQAQYSRPGE